MKVAVFFDGVDDELKDRMESFISDNWPHVLLSSANEDPPTKEGDNHYATLTVTNRRTGTPQPRTALNETILVNSESTEEVLYRANAKLGRLTSSDSIRSDQAVSVESHLSRREFLFGVFGRTPPPANGTDNAPIVSADSCEARFGCTKCVDACPAPGALEIREKSLILSKEHCIGCGLCAGTCPVAAIQMPNMSEKAYLGLISAIQNSPAPRKTLVITCDEEKVPKIPWVDVEQVPGIGTIGLRQLAIAASSPISATILYCPDGLCVGKDHVKRAVDVISALTKANPPSVHYLEGAESAVQIEHIHNSALKREGTFELTEIPWKNYVDAIENISAENSKGTGLGITDIQIAESCTLCNACVDRCPHKALGIAEGNLMFDPRNCTGCGYCEQICPEHSITLHERKDSVEFREKTVYTDEMVRCSKCNLPYASAKMIRKVSATLQINEMTPICPACREKEMYDALFCNPLPKVVN